MSAEWNQCQNGREKKRGKGENMEPSFVFRIPQPQI